MTKNYPHDYAKSLNFILAGDEAQRFVMGLRMQVMPG